MLKVEIFTVNPFQENTYLVYSETKEALLIDPGMYTEEEKFNVVKAIKDKGLKLLKIVNTHGHVDHLLGVNAIKKEFGTPHAYHCKDEVLIEGVKEHGLTFGFDVDQPETPGEYIEEGNEIKLGKDVLKVLHVPGHSPGHVALYSEKSNFVLVGDALFAGSIGRTDLPGGNFDTLINSIKNKLLVLPGHVDVYPGHGPSTTIEKEINTNPFFR